MRAHSLLCNQILLNLITTHFAENIMNSRRNVMKCSTKFARRRKRDDGQCVKNVKYAHSYTIYDQINCLPVHVKARRYEDNLLLCT